MDVKTAKEQLKSRFESDDLGRLRELKTMLDLHTCFVAKLSGQI
jgi:hypothetical protein